MAWRVSSLSCWLMLLGAALSSADLLAQQTRSVEGRYHPLNQYTPPGVAAEWAVNAGHATPGWFQPVRVTLPTAGRVTFFDGAPNRPVAIESPAQAALLVGRMYRFCVSELPEFPGAEFWPTIELIDRLHPPPGQVDRFPMTFEFTEEELELAAAGRLITKVVYLEQPDRVPLANLGNGLRITDIEPSRNPLAEADLLGRPVAIVRLGGRTPDLRAPDPQFFGPGGPVRLRAEPGAEGNTVMAPRAVPTAQAIARRTTLD